MSRGLAWADVCDPQKYIMDTEGRDYLMVGFSREGENPWREKSWSCALL